MRDLIGSLLSAVATLLGIAAVVAIGYNLYSANKSSNGLSDLTSMAGQIQALYSSHPSYSGLSATTVINASLAPSSMISGATLTNPWGGTVTVAVNGSNSSFFDVTEPNVPNDACAKLATGVGNLGALSINGTSVTLPADPNTVSTNCSTGANSLVFTFGH